MENIKIKPLKPVLQLTFPRTRPEKNENNYRDSLVVTELVKPRQEWDKARNSVVLDLIHAQNDLFLAEEELQEVRANGKSTFAESEAEWKELEVKQKNFRKNFIKFETFVKENQEKRHRAVRKLLAETELGTHYDTLTADLEERFKMMLDVKIKFDEQLKKYKVYEDFLVGIMTLVSFKDPVDVMRKHTTLLEMKDEVLKRRNRELDELDALKNKKLKMVESHMLNLLSTNGKIVDLICRHEAARTKALMWETAVGTIRHQAELKIAEMDAVKVGIWELYEIMCDRRQEPIKIDKDNFEEQAMYVKKTLIILKKVQQLLSNQKANDSVRPTVSKRKESRGMVPKTISN